MVRRLAREAVIFMLLGLLFTAIGNFIYMHHAEARRLPPCPIFSASTPDSPLETPQTENPPPVLHGYVCEDPLNHQHMFLVTDAPAPRFKINNWELAPTSAFLALYGFVGGLGVWLFYRVVRFAIKG
jgi:hypothetical protein